MAVKGVLERVRATHPGVKVSVVVGVLLLVAAGYSLLVPIVIEGSDGLFGCGSAAVPPTDAFQRGICQSLPEVYRYRAGALLLAALLVIGLGALLFGGRRPAGHSSGA